MLERAKYLITGASSGLGHYLVQELHGEAFDRNDMTNEIERNSQLTYDAIIHCAADTRNKIKPHELWSYYQSNIEFTKQLTQIPHHLFVYTSSPAVYSDNFRESAECDVPDFPETNSIIHHTYYLYGLFKLLAEQIVSRYSNNSLILRCGAIVGRTNKLSANITKVLRSDPSPLTLSANSSFNLVSMEQIKGFIELALAKKITGIFNLGSTQNATLAEIAAEIGSHPTFGNFIHNVHRMDTSKVKKVSNDFNQSSLEIAKKIAKEFKKGV